MKPHKFSHLLSALVIVARKYHNFESLREHLTVVLRDAIPVEHGSRGAPEEELRIVSAYRMLDLVVAEARLEQAEQVLRLLRCAARDWDYTGATGALTGVFRALADHDARNPMDVSLGSIPAVQEACAELDRSASKFPTWPTDPIHAVAIISEELGELTSALIQMIYEPAKGVTMEHIRAEAQQVAATALRFLQGMDHYQFAPCPQYDQPSRGVHHG